MKERVVSTDGHFSLAQFLNLLLLELVPYMYESCVALFWSMHEPVLQQLGACFDRA